jgi:hypothetical protein
VLWLTSARESIDSARTGGRRSSETKEASCLGCAVACTNILLTDFESQCVLQINDRKMAQTEIIFHYRLWSEAHNVKKNQPQEFRDHISFA